MICVLASGSGSNLQALINSSVQDRISLVISNNPGAKALKRASDAGIESVTVDHRAYISRNDFDQALADEISSHNVEWVVLAGFMRVVGKALLERFPRRIVNIHPSLLPSFPGLHGQRQAIEAGVRIAGCTVHIVDSGVDTGAILGQAATLVADDDTEDTLSRKILKLEHILYPAVIQSLLTKKLQTCPKNEWRLVGKLDISNDMLKDALFSP